MALIPPNSFDCVVAIGSRSPGGRIKWIGTGTLIGRYFKKFSETQSQYHIFIVTNKHVLKGHEAVVVRFNPRETQPARDYDIPLFDPSGNPLWGESPEGDIDIAAIGINADVLEVERIKYNYFQSDTQVMTLSEIAALGVSEGDFVYVLGFPMGIVDTDHQYVIARSGILARLRDTLEKKGKEFLIDAAVFPGNSGGPVIYKPEIISIDGTQSVIKPGLVGIVAGYLSYRDTAVSQQTGKTRVVFEENSGLAVVIPMDYVLETIEVCFSAMNIKEERVAH
ncbi:MAG: serine protease [Nitrospinota bacterium]|nr:serine protease [Nitrospinota bacterium]